MSIQQYQKAIGADQPSIIAMFLKNTRFTDNLNADGLVRRNPVFPFRQRP